MLPRWLKCYELRTKDDESALPPLAQPEPIPGGFSREFAYQSEAGPVEWRVGFGLDAHR